MNYVKEIKNRTNTERIQFTKTTIEILEWMGWNVIDSTNLLDEDLMIQNDTKKRNKTKNINSQKILLQPKWQNKMLCHAIKKGYKITFVKDNDTEYLIIATHIDKLTEIGIRTKLIRYGLIEIMNDLYQLINNKIDQTV